ncbi:MAG: antibiotic biosynthesis monooxygenase [Sphingomonadales bacterium]|nr:antibiotic biosynthesis monooxygenase [Sphingomonadales bacterium]
MYVVTVEFDVFDEHRATFLQAVKQQAKDSLDREAGCHHFDICSIENGDDEIIFLYELYDDRAAFDLHLESAHFLSFNEKTSPWTRNKTVRCGMLEQGTAE